MDDKTIRRRMDQLIRGDDGSVEEALLGEKWKDDVEIKSTGQHADKTVAELRKHLANLKGRSGEEAKKKRGELQFAIRAKTGWKKGKGATKETHRVEVSRGGFARRRVKEPIKKDQENIIITVEGGVIQHIVFPTDSGPFIEVRDFDIDGVEPEKLETDDEGNEYVQTIWNPED